VGADVLRDAAGLFFRDVSGADGVEQRGLTMIDVAHDGDHGRPLDAIRFDLGVLDLLHRFLLERDGLDGGAEVTRQLVSQMRLEGLVDRREYVSIDELFDHHAGFDIQLFGELLDGDAFGNRDFARDGRRTGRRLAARRPSQDSLFALRDAFAALRAGATLRRA